MKNFYLLTTLILSFSTLLAQNNAPVATNDSLLISYNDSISFIEGGSGYLMGNDSDIDFDNLKIDTAYYTGTGFFQFDSIINNVVRISYEPQFNFWGIDSAIYILKDDGIPVKYDTAKIYFFVKRPRYELLDLNNIAARLDLFGLFQDVGNSVAGFEVPKGSGSYTIYAGNLWMAGKNANQVYSSCETFGNYLIPTNMLDYFSRSGPIMDSMHYNNGVYSFEWDRLWKINHYEIDYHINNWSNVGYQPIEVIENWPAHGDTTKGQAYYLAPFVDSNNDGIYDPLQGDYPKIKGQQAVYFIYNDDRIASGSGGSMTAEVHYMAYAYKCPSDSAIDNTIFLDYTIYNRSNLTYDSTYIGFWMDCDIGGSTDDFVGSDVDRGACYCYNGDSIDEGGNGSLGYKNHPPAQGFTFLKGAKQDNDGIDNNFGININETVNGLGFGDSFIDNEYWGLEHFMSYSIGGGPGGDPMTEMAYYQYLQSIWSDSTHLVYGSTTTVPANFYAPGASDSFWYNTKGVPQSPWYDSFIPSDRRGVGSSGPFTFEPDSSVEITLAFVFGRDYQNTGNTAGLVIMQERIDSIRSYYETDFVSVCGGALSVDEKDIEGNNLQIYPNPFSNQFSLKYELSSEQAELKVFDVYGKLIHSTLLINNYSSIDLSNQAKGIYFVHVVEIDKLVVKKIIKQ